MKTAKQILTEQLRTATDCPVDVFKNKFTRQELERFAQYCIDKNHGNVGDQLACPNCGIELQLEVKEMTNSDLLNALKANNR